MSRRINAEWSRRMVKAIDEKQRDLQEGMITEVGGRRRAITGEERRLWHGVVDRMERQLENKRQPQ